MNAVRKVESCDVGLGACPRRYKRSCDFRSCAPNQNEPWPLGAFNQSSRAETGFYTGWISKMVSCLPKISRTILPHHSEMRGLCGSTLSSCWEGENLNVMKGREESQQQQEEVRSTWLCGCGNTTAEEQCGTFCTCRQDPCTKDLRLGRDRSTPLRSPSIKRRWR